MRYSKLERNLTAHHDIDLFHCLTGIPVKEETEEDPNEPTQFVNVPLDEAGPSGLQHQKMTEISEMTIAQAAEGDPKTG